MAVLGYCTGGSSTTAGATITLGLPAGAVAGSYLTISGTANLGSIQTATTDRGMTELLSVSNANTTLRVYVFGKVLTAADITAGSVTITWSSSGRLSASGVVLSGTNGTPSTPVSAAAAASSVGMPTAAGTGHVVLFGAARAASGTSPSISFSGFTTGAQGTFSSASGVVDTNALAVGLNTTSAGSTLSTSPVGDQTLGIAFHIPLAAVVPTGSSEELQHALQRVSGTTLDAQGAANVWAGTSGLDLVGALNAKAGTSGLELLGVCNVLAGTPGQGRGINACAAQFS